MRLKLRSDLGEIQLLTGAIAQFGAVHGIPNPLIDRLILVADELATNIISYSGTDLGIEVAMRVEDGRAVLEISDDGEPFDPFSAPPPDLDSPIERRPVGGLGIHLVRTLMDDFHYRRQDGKNWTTVAKFLSNTR